MLIPIVDDIKADPFLAQLFIILLLPIVGLVAFSLPFVGLYFLIKHVKKSNTKGLHSTAPKFTNRRQTLRRDLNNQERKSQDWQYVSGVDSSGRYQPGRSNCYRR
jgi:hypothetical protein|tara:strand:+ start:148 stop:462 length:315 start_codon:yes stop_codon:yes gene_type:complete